MARVSTTMREVQVPEEHRSGPRRTQSGGFMPAQRSSNPPQQQRFTTPPQQLQPEFQVQEGEETQDHITQPITKSGYPDRRFKGQRDLPPPALEIIEPRARTGGTIGDVHITIDGKPDRRFKENRGLSDEEVMAQWADAIQDKYGRNRQRR